MPAIGRGLVSSPKLLLLDERSMGLAPAIVERIARIQRESRLTVILVEQRAVEAFELCDRAYMLSTGQVALSGTGKELLRSEQVSRAYLGG